MTHQLVYGSDAIAAITMGTALLLLARQLTTLAGWSLPPGFLFGVGLFLLPWAGFNAWVSRQQSVPVRAALVHLVVDGSWVLGSVALWLFHRPSLTLFGVVLLLTQALAVLCVFALKLGGLVRPVFARR
ncbi:hypothetical protein [Myxococcus landrumensis]|uniref:Integral membrane protein n=1 Tax=Myxococcus landrumensis TaxID=2813577 RepID=A0ABX7N350_9BACT|nr:hypothetical protein [Myxococcus landrumus]QSQ12085.1 hypothetical protein JY572_27385 [Myxococcus landrumus]